MAIISGISGGISDPAFAAALARLDALEAADVALDGRLDTAESAVTTLQGHKQRIILWYGAAVFTAGATNRFLHPVGTATGAHPTATPKSYDVPVAGNLVAIHYHCSTPHSTNTVEVVPRYNGVETDVDFDVPASDARVSASLATPIAVEVDASLACRLNHNGATDLANVVVGFEIEFSPTA